MFTKGEIFFIFAETPVHCGSGSSVGTVDLPIQREVYNELPVIHGQSLKGAIRDFFEAKYNNSQEEVVEIIFGPKNTDYSSCISFGQANLLFFPIPSFKGVFAYATSIMCLEKFFRTFKMLYPETETQVFNNLKNKYINENKVLIASESAVNLENKVILSNLVFDVDNNDLAKNVDELANFLSEKIFKDKNYDFMKNILLKNLVILNDTVFSKLTKLKTEIVHRNKIGENGIVEEGALWTEEYLPSDTIMWSTIFVGQPKKNKDLKSEDDILKFIEKDLKTLFIGGNKTIGKGLVSIHFCEVQNEQK